MNARKILIVDDTEDFRLHLSQVLSARFQVRDLNDGKLAQTVLSQWQPDILVMDMLMVGSDGIHLLQFAASLPKRPMVLVVTALDTSFVLHHLEELGVQYLMRKPCEISRVAQRVGELACQLPGCFAAQPGNRHNTADILMELGFSNHRNGYFLLQQGLPLLAAHRNQQLSGQLYYQIAEATNGTEKQVEKSIRDAITNAWSVTGPAVWDKYFPGIRKRPSNKAFLFRIADMLNREQSVLSNELP